MAKSIHVIEANDVDFDEVVLKSDKPVLVDFTATWCGPCKALAPIVDKLADQADGKYKVVKVDIDQAPVVTARYGVRGVPTVMAFEAGAKKAQHVGVATPEKLLKLLG